MTIPRCSQDMVANGYGRIVLSSPQSAFIDRRTFELELSYVRQGTPQTSARAADACALTDPTLVV